MNYFRTLALISMLFFFSTPLVAIEPAPQASFWSNCYNYTSSWISSSLLVTREYVKRKFRKLRREFHQTRTELERVEANAAALNQEMLAAREQQRENRKLLEQTTKQHKNDLEQHKQELRGHEKNHEKLVGRIVTIHLATQEAGNLVRAGNDSLEQLKKINLEKHRALLAQEKQLAEEQKTNLQKIDEHFAEQNNRLNQTIALAEAARHRVVEFSSALDQMKEDSKKRAAEQKKNSQQISLLYQQTETQDKKISAFYTAFGSFSKDFYASRLPKASVPSFPGRPSGQSHSSERSASGVMEPVD